MVVTSILKRLQPQRQHLTALVVLLLLTFGMTLSLAWAAWDAAHDARAQAEDTMTGWAALAATGLKTRIEIAFVNGLYPTFQNVLLRPVEAAPKTAAELPGLLIPQAISPTLAHDSIDFWFRQDMKTGEIDIAGGVPEAAVRTWLQARIRSTALAVVDRENMSGVAVATGKAAGEVRIAYFAVLNDRSQVPVAAYGFVARHGLFEDLLDRIWSSAQLLLHAANAANDSVLFARVLDSSGVPLYASPMPYDTVYEAERLLAEPMAGARLRMAVRPDAAEALIVGGVPELPFARLAGLLTVTLLLIVSGLYLIRREADLSRLRADFIAGVSHELRTPLAQIRMFAETLMLGRVRSESERTRSLEIIDQEARRLAHLVENVLIFAKSERRKSRINPQLTDLPADVREAVQGFAVLSRSRDIEIRTELLEGLAAPVDRGALRQILLNLLDNAVKYGPLQQRITVGLALFDDTARIWVDDEGPGIPADQREKVFGRFVRLARDAESPVGGSGIGLAIVRELALLHGGRVWIEDAPGGRGARVVVEFPGAYVRPDVATGGWAVA